MRIALYSRWVDTLGGGEQTLGAFASVLAEQHDVELLAHERPDWSRFQDTLGFDLTALPTRLLAHDEDHYRPLQQATRDYDVFINCSYLDHVRAYARLNVMQVFFPPEPPAGGGVRPAPVPPRGGPTIRAIAGLHPLERDGAGVFAWSDGHARFALDGLAGATTVTLTLGGRPRDAPRAAVEVQVDGRPARSLRLPATGLVDVRVPVRAPGRAGETVFIDVLSDTFVPSRTSADPRTSLGVRVAGATAGPRRRPRPAEGLDRWTDPHRYVDALAGYQLLLANSHFTQRWIARRCGRSSSLLYPPVQVGQFAPARKKQQIISVGRFFVEGHTKKQLEMIHTFRRLCDDGLTGWQYHLVGGTNTDLRSVRYLQDCRDAARGYPITVHADAPLRALIGLYAESALYWNATGYGEDPDLEPDRFEHFGMTTVEAMASGCVPLSYARAGQPEVVDHDVSGILWDTLDELRAQTRALIGDVPRRDQMAAAAVTDSESFGYDRFSTTLRRLLADAVGEQA